jgi:hypothetical protein
MSPAMIRGLLYGVLLSMIVVTQLMRRDVSRLTEESRALRLDLARRSEAVRLWAETHRRVQEEQRALLERLERLAEQQDAGAP